MELIFALISELKSIQFEIKTKQKMKTSIACITITFYFMFQINHYEKIHCKIGFLFECLCSKIIDTLFKELLNRGVILSLHFKWISFFIVDFISLRSFACASSFFVDWNHDSKSNHVFFIYSMNVISTRIFIYNF